MFVWENRRGRGERKVRGLLDDESVQACEFFFTRLHIQCSAVCNRVLQCVAACCSVSTRAGGRVLGDASLEACEFRENPATHCNTL